MKILLIDDLALKGWKQILEIALFENTNIDYSESFNLAKKQLEANFYDLIFLDLRLDESDHSEIDMTKFKGFKIIKEIIRKEFNSLNFSTPVLLLSATNKMWNIDFMMRNGVDDYYIKEHPDNSLDINFSIENFKRLKKTVPALIELGIRRRKIWTRIINIELTLKCISNENIRTRIKEKLRIGYGLLFRKTTSIENENLIFNNEIISFIAFWSILEEIVKEAFVDNWIKSGKDEGKMKENKWVLKNKSIFINDLRTFNLNKNEGFIQVGIKYNNTNQYYEVGKTNIGPENPEINFYTGKIGLNLQVNAMLLLGKMWKPSEIKQRFNKLNDYRNKIDFIHSSVDSIFNQKLSNNTREIEGFEKCVEMLDFIEDILK